MTEVPATIEEIFSLTPRAKGSLVDKTKAHRLEIRSKVFQQGSENDVFCRQEDPGKKKEIRERLERRRKSVQELKNLLSSNIDVSVEDKEKKFSEATSALKTQSFTDLTLIMKKLQLRRDRGGRSHLKHPKAEEAKEEISSLDLESKQLGDWGEECLLRGHQMLIPQAVGSEDYNLPEELVRLLTALAEDQKAQHTEAMNLLQNEMPKYLMALKQKRKKSKHKTKKSKKSEQMKKGKTSKEDSSVAPITKVPKVGKQSKSSSDSTIAGKVVRSVKAKRTSNPDMTEVIPNKVASTSKATVGLIKSGSKHLTNNSKVSRKAVTEKVTDTWTSSNNDKRPSDEGIQSRPETIFPMEIGKDTSSITNRTHSASTLSGYSISSNSAFAVPVGEAVDLVLAMESPFESRSKKEEDKLQPAISKDKLSKKKKEETKGESRKRGEKRKAKKALKGKTSSEEDSAESQTTDSSRIITGKGGHFHDFQKETNHCDRSRQVGSLPFTIILQ